MARDESDREDLLREAVALSRRAELEFEDREEPVFLGFKRDGGLSIYLGPDPVYQFNPLGQLRRAYRNGLLYRTQGTTLAELNRDRSQQDRVTLQRRDLEERELGEFLEEMTARLHGLQQRLSARSYQRFSTVPEEADLIPEFLSALELVFSAAPRLAPAIKGRR
ncbi:MAG: hypothetical protein HUJ26_08325 [Planctomycetaceae bacterium]|nr:hypothetical protein [Planctomycetaceae bacterium]